MASNEAELDRMRLLLTAAAERTTCPSPDALARAASDEATIADRRAVADHLAACAECSEEYRVASSLGTWSRDASGSDAIADLTRSADESAAAVGARAPSHIADARGARSRSPRALFTAPRWAWLAAALVVVSVAALLVWSLSLRQEHARLASQLGAGPSAPGAAHETATPSSSSAALDDLRRRVDTQAAELASMRARLDDAVAPALNVPIVDLLPREAARGATTAPVVRVPAGARMVTFVVSVATEPAARDHELEIVGPSGTVLWRGSGLRPNAEKTFTVTIPRALLPAGRCQLRLSVTHNGTRRVVGDYAVVMESQS